jgi:hypothetical protein
MRALNCLKGALFWQTGLKVEDVDMNGRADFKARPFYFIVYKMLTIHFPIPHRRALP